MTEIECPECKARVDIDRPSVIREEGGVDIRVRCPHCRAEFIIEKAEEVRRKLRKARYGFARFKDGTTIKIRL
jgi:transposase-like protein